MRFRLKITLYMLCLLSLLFAVGGTALISVSFNNSLKREKDSAIANYSLLLNTLQVVNGIDVWENAEDLSKILSQLLSQNAASWQSLRLESPGENDIFLSGADARRLTNYSDIAQPESLIITSHEKADGGRYLQISTALTMGEETLYLDAASDITNIYELRLSQQQIYRRIYLIMTAICAVLTYSISWLLTRPLGKLSRASRELAAGNLSSRSNVKTRDEIGDLAKEFDNMAETLENQVLELEDSMERQERFIGGFTHELKTPMASIIGYSDLLRGQMLTPEEQAEAANYIFTEGKRLSELSSKLLEIIVADKQELNLHPTDPSVLIRRVLETSMPHIGREIIIDVSCQPGRCLMDADLIASLLFNLIENARKALSGKGNIRVSSKMTDSGCIIQVSDNGKGISPQALKHITEAFYREDKSRSRGSNDGGAGLGLSLCDKIAKLHGGYLSFDSSPGEGTTVTAVLRGGR